MRFLSVCAFSAAVYCAGDFEIANSGFSRLQTSAMPDLLQHIGREDQKTSTGLTLLGPEESLLRNDIRSQASHRRVLQAKRHISQALRLNCLTPSVARKLRGRPGFCASLFAEKLGRWMMVPLISRQYRSRTAKLTCARRMCLPWPYRAAGSLPPRKSPFALFPIGAHPDVQGLGQIACMVLLHRVITGHAHLPTWFARMAQESGGEAAIFLSESRAAILTAFFAIVINTTVSRSGVLCIGSQAALASQVNGSTTSALGASLVCLLCGISARPPSHRRIEYANAKSNDADENPHSCAAQSSAVCLLHEGLIQEVSPNASQSRGARRMSPTRLRIEQFEYFNHAGTPFQK